jgi:hypothetical protein
MGMFAEVVTFVVEAFAKDFQSGKQSEIDDSQVSGENL